MNATHIVPTLNGSSFNCPHCGAIAHQVWGEVYVYRFGGFEPQSGWTVATCNHCSRSTWWNGKAMVYPLSSAMPMPVQDMPDTVKADYLEAREIAAKSPRGAAALLRLAIQKLASSLDEKKANNLNDNIANLVKQGLPPKVREALDVVRVIGNEAVHPGVIDLKDDINTATALFKLVNIIVERMITEPDEVDALYASLPTSKREAIEKRDGKKQ